MRDMILMFNSGNISLIGIFIVILLILTEVILTYILQSLAIYKFMKKRNLNNAFLSFIPILRFYAIGKVYDDINLKKEKQTNFKNMMFFLCSFTFLIYWISAISVLVTLIFFMSFISLIVLQIVFYGLIFKTYAPNKPSYFIMSLIFTIIPIVPFLPGVFLLKASKNQPTY